MTVECNLVANLGVGTNLNNPSDADISVKKWHNGKKRIVLTSVAAFFMFYGNTWSDPRDDGYGQRNN